MINRVKELFGDPEEARPPTGGKQPRWLRFTDVHGSQVTVRGVLIEYVRECTEAQRIAEREFHRARHRERKVDRTWDDDDWY